MNEYSATDQRQPVSNEQPQVWKLVIKDMEDRNKWGIEKYDTPLQPFNGRNSLIDMYQEILDFSVYCRQKIEENIIITELLETVLDDMKGVYTEGAMPLKVLRQVISTLKS